MSGPYATAIGNPFARAVEMATEDVNAKGGITVGGQKYTIQVKAYDDKYNAEGGSAAVQKAIYEDKLSFIIGPQGSAAVLAAQPIAEKEKVLLFVASVTEKDTGKDKPFTFQGILSAREITADFYKTLRQTYPQVKTMAVLNPNDESGWADTERLTKEAEAAGFQVVAKEFYQRGTSDYYPALTKLMAKNPDAIDIAVTVPAGVPLKQARELGYKGKIWGAGVDAASLMSVAGPAAEEFVGYFMSPDLYGPDATPAQKSLAERYKTKYNETVTSFYVEQAYDITRAVLKAIETAGSLDTTKVAETLRSDKFEWETVVPNVKGRMMGEQTYGIRSIVSTAFYLTQIKGGKVIVLATATDKVP
jgi:branched-chain amino acid transport system substrate-binding protein